MRYDPYRGRWASKGYCCLCTEKTSDDKTCLLSNEMILTKKFPIQHCCSLVLYNHDGTSLRLV